MYRDYLTARSPVRLLEKGLHGGLGAGNVGLVLAGHGVGKSSFLVGLALDELLRGGDVLHVGLDQTVDHVRAYYDTLFEDLSSQSQLEDVQQVHADADRHRHIRTYLSDSFNAAKLREALKIETDAGTRPRLLIVDGADPKNTSASDVAELRALAKELGAEAWVGVASDAEKVEGMPAALEPASDHISVVLALQPGGDHVLLQALKDHDNPDVSALHVALDPKTLLLVRH